MASAADFLRAYRDQAGLEPEESVTLVADFLASYGMTEGAADTLCEYIEDEGLAEDFVSVLRENGLTIEPGSSVSGEDEVDDFD